MSALGQKPTYAAAKCDVRFTPESDRESELCQKGHVRFTPESGRLQRN